MISNELDFVKSVVVGNEIGFAVDFARRAGHRGGVQPGHRRRATTSRRWRVGRATISNSISIGSTFSSRCGEILPGWRRCAPFSREVSDIDFGWIDDPQAMRAPASEVLRSADIESSEIAKLTGIGQLLLRAALLAGRVARVLRGPGRAGRIRAAIRVRVYRLLPARRGYAAK